MGAMNFYQRAKGKTPKDAFIDAVEEAAWENGHGGYTGTIAEKDSFTIIPLPADKNAADYAHELIRADDPRISDKWGPAGCIQTGPEEFLFFGWASS